MSEETQDIGPEDAGTLATADAPKTAKQRLAEFGAEREVLELEVELEDLKEGGASTDSDEYRDAKRRLRDARMRYRAMRDGQAIIEDHKGRPYAVPAGSAEVVADAFDKARVAREAALDAAEAAAAEGRDDDDSPDATVTPGQAEAAGATTGAAAGGDAQ